jgi:hypothetical protein
MRGYRKHPAELLFAVVFAVFLSSCVDMNTPVILNAAGFHAVENSYQVLLDNRITGLATDGKNVAAVSRQGNIAFSGDYGVTWTAVSAVEGGDGITYNSVVWGAGYFFAGGDGGRAAYSPDGISWRAGVIGPMNPKNISAVAAGMMRGQAVFAAAGNDGRLAYSAGSPEGPWYQVNLSPFGEVQDSGDDIYALTYGQVNGEGIFVAAGNHGKIAFMNDFSRKWYGMRAGANESLRGLSYGNDRFVAVGDNGFIKYCVNPADYIWLKAEDTGFELRPLSGAAYDPVVSNFIVYSEDSVIGFSEHGEKWRVTKFQGDELFRNEKISALVCTNRRIVIGGEFGTLAYSN